LFSPGWRINYDIIQQRAKNNKKLRESRLKKEKEESAYVWVAGVFEN